MRVDPLALALSLAIGSLGGVAAHLAHLPLGYLLGSMIATGVLAALDIRPFGRPITLPQRLRFAFVPVIGVAIGGAFTPEVARAALQWGPSILALCLFVPLAHAMGYHIYRRGGLPADAAYFSAVPGGLIESVQMAEEAGADARLVTVLQFLRLILTILTVPFLFWGLTGHAVGSAAGASLPGAGLPMGWREGALMVAAGAIGALVARRLSLPGYIITGPLVLSAALHATGVLTTIPPGWLIAVTQIVLGTGLGARFTGTGPALLARLGRLALVNGAATLALAGGFALLVHWMAAEPLIAAFLAFAPGGLAEMSLIALSLNMNVIYVTSHHVARIVLAIAYARWGRRFLRGGCGG